MPITVSDAVTEEAVRNRVEEVVQANLQYRQAFREVPVPDGVGETWNIPQPDDTIGEPATIPAGADYPSAEEDYSKIAITREKIGMVLDFLDEAVMENTSFDLVADQVDRAARQMREHLDGKAFTELDGNLNSSSPAGGNAGSMAWADMVEGHRILRDAGYNTNLIVLDAHAEEDLLQVSEFNRATEQGDAVVEEGEIARMLGAPVVVETTGDAAQHDAYMVDTRFYGYEAVWTPFETEAWRSESSDTEHRKLRTFRAWTAIDAEAAIKIQG